VGRRHDWLLDAGAKRGARISLADLSAQRAGYDLAELTWKQRSALRRAAVDLLITEREIALRETVNTDRQAQLDMSRRRLEAGAAARAIWTAWCAMHCRTSSSCTTPDGVRVWRAVRWR